MDVITILEIINVLLLVGILAAYWQNWRQIKAPITVALMVFVGLFLLQNVIGLALGAMNYMYFAKEVEPFMMVLTGIQTIGFAVLLWITWKM